VKALRRLMVVVLRLDSVGASRRYRTSGRRDEAKNQICFKSADTYIEYEPPNCFRRKHYPYVDALRRRKVKISPRLGRALVKVNELNDVGTIAGKH